MRNSFFFFILFLVGSCGGGTTEPVTLIDLGKTDYFPIILILGLEINILYFGTGRNSFVFHYWKIYPEISAKRAWAGRCLSNMGVLCG